MVLCQTICGLDSKKIQADMLEAHLLVVGGSEVWNYC